MSHSSDERLRPLWVAGAIAALSGGAALTVEIVLIHLLSRTLGSTALATAAAAGAFLFSMGLGSLIGGKLAHRAEGPARAIALVQLSAAIWSATAIWSSTLIENLSDRTFALIDEPTGLIFANYGFAFALLLLPGLLAGAIIPLLAPLAAKREEPGKGVAKLWALDSAGAAVGAAITGLWLLPSLGAGGCLWSAAAVHLVAGALSLKISAKPASSTKPKADRPAKNSKRPNKSKKTRVKPGRISRPKTGILMLILAGAGMAGIGWQSIWARMLVLTLPGSLIAPAMMIACWIGGGSLGAWLYRASSRLRLHPELTLGLGQVVCAASALLGVVFGSWLRDSLAAARPLPAVPSELFIAAVLCLPAALAMGLALPAAIDLLSGSGRHVGHVTGQALAADMVGAGGGAFAIPFALLPLLGLPRAILVLALGQAIFGAMMLFRTSAGRFLKVAAAALLVVATLASQRVDLRPWSEVVVDGQEVEPLRVIWGPAAAAATVRAPDGTLQLIVDRHHGMGGERGLFIERRQGHLPLLLHGRPRTVAVLGVGTGNTLGAITRHDLQQLEAAENLAGVLGMIDLFAQSNRRVWRDERLRIHRADGHAFLRRSQSRYDVIINDLVHPWRAGAQGLYSLEHLRLVRQRLAPGGLFCFWLPLHQLDRESLAVVSATFQAAFEGRETTLLLGHLGWRQPILALITRGEESEVEVDEMLRRDRLLGVLGDEPPTWLVEADLDRPEDVQSLYLGGSSLLRELAGDAPTTTWERPILAYRAADTWWRGTEGLGRATLSHVLDHRQPIQEVAGDDMIAARRSRAVEIFLRAELAEASGDLDGAILGYTEAAREDPSFGLPRIAITLLRRRLDPSI